jgi:branched-chain amino acid transport system ATP-binding protein
MMTVENISVCYGAIRAVTDVWLSVGTGEAVCILGANGAGKSTVLKAISGLLPLVQGSIIFEGRDITRLDPRERVMIGICQVPEGRQLFTSMSVKENLEMGAYCARSLGKREIIRRMESVYEVFSVLKVRARQDAATLSGGEQQMLALGRALMSRPRLLLTDEPSLGLAPIVVAEVFKVIRHLKEKGMALLIAEQNAKGALKVVDRGFVLETGKISVAGSREQLACNAEVQQAYLGA